MKAVKLDGKTIIVNSDLSMRVVNDSDFSYKDFTRSEVEAIRDAHKGMNRIHKPQALLFWIDVKCHQYSNYDLINLSNKVA